MYATLAPPSQVIHRRRPSINGLHGRQRHPRSLSLPSQRVPLDGHGLGDFLDIVKNLGKGVTSVLTGGIYDLSKNRFYVPFTGGQVRNLLQGFTNTTSLGLVNTDKFFNTQTMRTIGNIGAGIEAAAVAAIGGAALMGTGPAAGLFGTKAATAGSTIASSSSAGVAPSTASLFSNPAMQSAQVARLTSSAVAPAALPSTTSLFATAPITGAYANVPTIANAFGTALTSSPSLLSQIGSGIKTAFETIPKVLDTATKIMRSATPLVQAAQQVTPDLITGSTLIPGGDSIVIGGAPMTSGGDALLPASYLTGGMPGMMGGGGVAIPIGGPEGTTQNMEAGFMDNPIVPYVVVLGAIGAIYYLWR